MLAAVSEGRTSNPEPKSRKFPVFSLMIREFDRGEQFASDCVIRHPVHDFRFLRTTLLNDAHVREVFRFKGTGEA